MMILVIISINYLDVSEEVAVSVDEARNDSNGGDSVSVNSEPKNESSYNGDNSGEDNDLSDICDDIILEDEPGDSDFSDNDDGQEGDDAHGRDTSDSGDSNVILISDTDKRAVAILDETVVIQTFVITVRKRTRYINGGMMDSQVQVEIEYYQHKG